MNNFIFENATKVIFGKGCVKNSLPELIAKYGPNVMLAYGGGSIKKNGIYEEIMEILHDAGKTVVEFSGIMPNPTYAKVLEGAQLAKQNKIELILAVGGGSVMDCCKAVSLAAVYGGDVWNDFWAVKGAIDFEPLPLGIVVTVSGTGSEMNGGAVITNEELKLKTGWDYPELNAKFALLDPVYTYTVPKFQMISGGFDSLSHMMEIYFSEPDTENISDDINEALMRGVIRDLRAAIQDPQDYTARSNMMWEATMAENRILKLGKKTDFEWHEYILYGGLPSVVQLRNSEQKSEYLKNIFEETYINDIIGRHKVKNRAELEELLNTLSSGIGSLTNPKKLADTFKSVKQVTLSAKTINNYLDYLCDSFLITAAHRYDIKGRKYIGTPMKYYFSDIGLRNARINFRQLEEPHTMENIIYNELLIRGYNIDVGVVVIQQRDSAGKMMRKQLEVDFVCNKGSKRYYIQSAYSMPTAEKMEQEQRSLVRIEDSFKKIIITKDTPTPTYNDAGILVMNVYDFLLNADSLEQ